MCDIRHYFKSTPIKKTTLPLLKNDILPVCGRCNLRPPYPNRNICLKCHLIYTRCKITNKIVPRNNITDYDSFKRKCRRCPEMINQQYYFCTTCNAITNPSINTNPKSMKRDS